MPALMHGASSGADDARYSARVSPPPLRVDGVHAKCELELRAGVAARSIPIPKEPGLMRMLLQLLSCAAMSGIAAMRTAPTTRRIAAPVMTITVCQGGACRENGGDLLLDVVAALSSGDLSCEVAESNCCGECPAAGAVLSPDRAAESYIAPAASLDEAIESATGAIVAAGHVVADGLTEAFTARCDAERARKAGDSATAIAKLTDALSSVPPGLFEACQPPVDDEEVEWESTAWDVSEPGVTASAVLSLCESAANFEFGECAGAGAGAVTLLGCSVDGAALAGEWEGEDGAGGEFALEMSADGRTFSGTLTDEASGDERAWSAIRRGRGRGRRRGEAAPLARAWIHQMLLDRASLKLAAGNAGAAAADARQAVRLCPRTASGWRALEKMARAGGEEAEAEDAAAEAAWLGGFR